MDRRFADSARRRASGEDATGAREPASIAPSLLARVGRPLRPRVPHAVGALAVLAILLATIRGGDDPDPDDGLVAATERRAVVTQNSGSQPAPPPPAATAEDARIEVHDDTIIQDLDGLDIPEIDPGSIMLLPGCDSSGPQPVGPNGRLPASALCTVKNIPLRADAAEALTRMNEAYAAEFGEDMCLGNGYRDYDQQASMHRDRPHLVAPPGQSNHGLGLAVDFCGNNQTRGMPEYTWMLENAETYGWILPPWAQPGGSRPEPWHWEYVGAGRIS